MAMVVAKVVVKVGMLILWRSAGRGSLPVSEGHGRASIALVILMCHGMRVPHPMSLGFTARSSPVHGLFDRCNHFLLDHLDAILMVGEAQIVKGFIVALAVVDGERLGRG